MGGHSFAEWSTEYWYSVAYFAVLACRSPVELIVDLLAVRVSWDEVFRLPVLQPARLHGVARGRRATQDTSVVEQISRRRRGVFPSGGAIWAQLKDGRGVEQQMRRANGGIVAGCQGRAQRGRHGEILVDRNVRYRNKCSG